MGKTERRNVSQKKRSPVRTSLKLRKEKKMKGGELSEGDIDMIKNRSTNFKDTILKLVNKYEAKMNESGYIMNESGYIIEKKKKKKKSDQLNNMIRAYFDKEIKNEVFSKNYRTYIINVITTLKTSLIDLNNKKQKIPPGYVSTQEEYNKLTILIQSVKNFITIMKAIAEGAKIKIAAEDGTGKSGAATTPTIAADDKSGELGDGTNITVTATTDLAAVDTNIIDDDKSDTVAAAAESDDKSAIVKTTASTNKSDTSEIDKLKEGFAMIYNISNMMKDNITNKIIKSTASEVLLSSKRIIYAFLFYKNKNNEIKNKFEKIVKHNKDSNILFFSREDIERLLKGELIITETDIMNARDRLSQLNSDVNNSLKNKVIENSKNELTKKTFEKNIIFLIELLDEIEKEVEKESQDTTSETKDKSNTNTNKIKETNNITIDSDEELVTLNITDQEGHIICSYILKFTRKGQGESLTIASASEFKRDPINDQFDTPTIVLTVKMNEPFTINGNSFIISN